MSMTWFGYQGGGSSVYNRHRIYGSKYSIPYPGEIIPDTIWVYSKQGSTNNWKCAIYDAAYNFIAETEERRINFGQFYEFDIITPDVVLSGGEDYFLCSWSDCYQDGGYTNGSYDLAVDSITQELTYGAFPATLTPSVIDNKQAIYCMFKKIGRSGRRRL